MVRFFLVTQICVRDVHTNGGAGMPEETKEQNVTAFQIVSGNDQTILYLLLYADHPDTARRATKLAREEYLEKILEVTDIDPESVQLSQMNGVDAVVIYMMQSACGCDLACCKEEIEDGLWFSYDLAERLTSLQ